MLKQSGLKTRVTRRSPNRSYRPSNTFHVVTRSLGDPTHLAGILRNQVSAIDKDQPIVNVKTMEKSVAGSMTQDRLSVFVLALFGSLAMALAATSIYGVFAYSVSQRTQEIGIRIALGAQQQKLLKLVLG